VDGYRDRADAGRALAAALAGRVPPGALVLGLARGGVPVAAEVAGPLGGELDALCVAKVRHPLQPEYALGAVVAGAEPVLRGGRDLDAGALARAVTAAREDAAALALRLRGGRDGPDPAGRDVVLVDDGLATGATMEAAVRWAAAGGARSVTVAVPVGPPETVAHLREAADAVVCPLTPRDLRAVSLWFTAFPQVGDAEVRAALPAARG
jgi:putative phosphoribosyl transferase